MTYPPKPSIQTSYTAVEQALGDGSLPGQELDVDFDGLKTAVDALNDFVRNITRSDGRLANGTVTRDTLASDLLLGVDPPAPWESGKEYTPPATTFEGNRFYIANTPHVSTVFADDLAAGRWVELADLTGPLTEFFQRYIGPAAADPSTTPTGGALVVGMLYYNTVEERLRAWTGSAWLPAAGMASLAEFRFVSTAAQTVFTGFDEDGGQLSFLDAPIQVFLNGVRLVEGTDFTTSDGDTITLASGAADQDVLTVTVFRQFDFSQIPGDLFAARDEVVAFRDTLSTTGIGPTPALFPPIADLNDLTLDGGTHYATQADTANWPAAAANSTGAVFVYRTGPNPLRIAQVLAVTGSANELFYRSRRVSGFGSTAWNEWVRIPNSGELERQGYFRGITTVAELLADTSLSYTAGAGKQVVTVGGRLKVGDFSYEFLASDATDEDVETAGGVKLRMASGVPNFDVTLNVPGDYPTPQEALDASLKFQPQSGVKVQILLGAGYKLPSGTRDPGSVYTETATTVASFLCENADYSSVWLNSIDATVPVAEGFAGHVMRVTSANSPVFNILVDMDGEGRGGIFALNANIQINGGCGVINAGDDGTFDAGRGLHAVSSRVIARSAVFDGAARHGIRISDSSSARIRLSSAKNCGVYGLFASGASNVAAQDADFSGCQTGIFANSLARVLARNVDVRGASQDGVNASEGAFVLVDNGQISDAGSPAGRNGLNARDSAEISANGATSSHAVERNVIATEFARINFRDGVGTDGGDFDIAVFTGGTIWARGATGNLSKRPNFVDRNGLILSNDVVAASGFAQIPSGNTSVVVTHGLAFTPGNGQIQVTPISDWNGAEQFRITAIGDTTFEIRCSPAPSANFQFGWSARAAP